MIAVKPLAIVLPHREAYQVNGAGAVVSCVRDMAVHSRYRERLVVLGDPVAEPFAEPPFIPVEKAPWFYGRQTARYREGMARALRAMRPALAEVHNRPYYIERLRKSLPGTPLILYLHNDPHKMRGFTRLADRVRIMRHVSAAVCVSDYIRRRLLEGMEAAVSDKAHVVLNGVDTSTVTPVTGRPRRKEILFVGRLIPEKGALLFAQAARKAQARLPGWRFVMIGALAFRNEAQPQHPYEKQVIAAMQQLGTHGEMTGYMPRRAALDRFAEAAIAVIPSLWEDPCPLAAIEAMASGCAVIATRRGGLPEILGDTALFIERDDPDLLAEKMVQLASDEHALAGWQSQARDRAVQALDIRRASAQLDEIRQQLLD